MKILQPEQICTALGAFRPDLRCVNLRKTFAVQKITESSDHAFLDAEFCTLSDVAQRDRTVIQIRLQRRRQFPEIANGSCAAGSDNTQIVSRRTLKSVRRAVLRRARFPPPRWSTLPSVLLNRTLFFPLQIRTAVIPLSCAGSQMQPHPYRGWCGRRHSLLPVFPQNPGKDFTDFHRFFFFTPVTYSILYAPFRPVPALSRCGTGFLSCIGCFLKSCTFAAHLYQPGWLSDAVCRALSAFPQDAYPACQGFCSIGHTVFSFNLMQYFL